MSHVRIVDAAQVSINIVRVQSGDLLFCVLDIFFFGHGRPPLLEYGAGLSVLLQRYDSQAGDGNSEGLARCRAFNFRIADNPAGNYREWSRESATTQLPTSESSGSVPTLVRLKRCETTTRKPLLKKDVLHANRACQTKTNTGMGCSRPTFSQVPPTRALS